MSHAVGPVAPVALFAHRRPDHTKAALEALRTNTEAILTDLIVYVDGPRNEAELSKVEEVRRIAERAKGFRSVRVKASEINFGLSRALIGGISEVLETCDRVIVLEDDIVVSPYFLRYMNDHLALYEDEENVASVHAYVYPHEPDLLPSTFFILGADCWGWGTWRRAWNHFNPDGRLLLDALRHRGLISTFDFGGTAPYKEMLIDQIAGRNDSWAVRWYASALLEGMMTLYPDRAMAVNIGEDGSGSHAGSSDLYLQELSKDPVDASRIPARESPEGRRAFETFFLQRYRLPSSRPMRLAWRYARRARARLRHR